MSVQAGEMFPVGYGAEYTLDDGRQVRIEKISDGIGFGSGAISRLAIEADASPELPDRMHVALTDPALLQPISQDKDGRPIQDDGCGDGRRVGYTYAEHQLRRTSLLRPKVFGGGLAQVSAARIGLGGEDGSSITELADKSHADIRTAGMEYGGHTVVTLGTHQHGSGCGCWDEFPEAVRATGQYASRIAPLAGLLMDATVSLDPGSQDDLQAPEVFANFRRFGEQPHDDHDGSQIIKGMFERGVVVKALLGDHLETDTVINMVAGFTADQELPRQRSAGQAGIFSVDGWRMAALANGLYEPVDRQRALLSMYAFTLGVAATLAAGDQRVWLAREVA